MEGGGSGTRLLGGPVPCEATVGEILFFFLGPGQARRSGRGPKPGSGTQLNDVEVRQVPPVLVYPEAAVRGDQEVPGTEDPRRIDRTEFSQGLSLG